MRSNYLLFIAAFSMLTFACTPEEKEAGEQKEKEEVQTEKEKLSEIDSLTLLIEKEPTKGLYMVRAQAYNELGQFDKSVADGQAVYNYNKEDYDNIIFYADIMMDALLYSPGMVEVCKKLYEQAIELKPQRYEGYLGMGKVYALVNNPDEAFTFINKALQIDENLYDAYYLKGFIYQKQGKAKLAVSSYITAVEQNPEFTDGYITLGSILAKYGDPKSQSLSEGYFKTALDLEPNNKDAMYGLGMLYQEQDKLDEAVALYKKITALDTTYAIAYFNQAYLYMTRSDYLDSAVFYFEKAIAADTLYADAYNNLGLTYEKKGQKEKAKKYYRKALELNPQHEKARKNIETLYK